MICFDALNDEWLSLRSGRELRGNATLTETEGFVSCLFWQEWGSLHALRIPHPSGPVPIGLSTRIPILGTAASPVFLREDCIPSSCSVDT